MDKEERRSQFLDVLSDVRFDSYKESDPEFIIFRGKLDQKETSCIYCNKKAVRNGKAKGYHLYYDLPFESKKTKLLIKDQRWKCHPCNVSWTTRSIYMDDHYQITNRLKRFIFGRFFEVPQSQIVRETGVCKNSVSNIINGFADEVGKKIPDSRKYLITKTKIDGKEQFLLSDIKYNSAVDFAENEDKFKKILAEKKPKVTAAPVIDLDFEVNVDLQEVGDVIDIAKVFPECRIYVNKKLFDEEYVYKSVWKSYKAILKQEKIRPKTTLTEENYIWFLDKKAWGEPEYELYNKIVQDNPLFLACFEARDKVIADKYYPPYITAMPSSSSGRRLSRMDYVCMNPYIIQERIWNDTAGYRLDIEYNNIRFTEIDQDILDKAHALGEAIIRDTKLSHKAKLLKYSPLFNNEENRQLLIDEYLRSK